MARQPRMVANETSMVAREASCAAAGPTRPAASASAVTAPGTPAIFRPLFGNKCSTHSPLAADADSRQQPQNRQLPNAGDKGAEKREHGIPGNRQQQRSNAAELVAHRPPQKCQPPSKQEK